MTRKHRSENIIVFCLYVLMLCGISVPNSGVLNSLNSLLSKLPLIEIVGNIGNYQLTQTRYSYLGLSMLLCILLLAMSILIRHNKKVLSIKKSFTALSILILFICLSAIINYEILSVLKCILYFLIIYCCSHLKTNEKKRIRERIEKTFIITAVINSAVILIQFFSMYSFSGISWNILRLFRCEGIMSDSIIAGFLNACAIYIILFNPSNKLKTIDLIFVCIFIITGLLTGSRTFYITLALIFIFKYLMYENKSRKLLFSLILACLVLLALFFSQYYLNKYTAFASGIEDSSRAIKRELALKLFRKHPILGAGTNQYRKYERGFTSLRGISGTNPHNIYFQILCENGIIAFFLMIVSSIQLMIRTINNRDQLAVCILALYLVIGWTIGLIGSVRITALVFAIIASTYKKKREKRL